jgi:hypothetical protein
VGETENQPFQLSFNGSLKVDFQGSRVTSDAGLLLGWELDERLGFSGLIEQPAAAGPTLAGRTPSCLLRIPQRGTAIGDHNRTNSPGPSAQHRPACDPVGVRAELRRSLWLGSFVVGWALVVWKRKTCWSSTGQSTKRMLGARRA